MAEDSSGDVKCNLHSIETESGIQTILEIPSALPGIESNEHDDKTIFNIVMADVSGSMKSFWGDVESGWNEHVAPLLTGFTRMFVFGSKIVHLRDGVKFYEKDFKCSLTNLTEAIKTIRHEIEGARQRNFVRVFLITDGDHTSTSIEPSVEIAKLYIPFGKTIEVFLLGIGNNFPVEYSITIRSRLHNGNSNVPSIFWAKSSADIHNELLSIADIVKRTIADIHISEPGLLCPEFPETEIVHNSEYVLLKNDPEKIRDNLKLFLKDSKGNRKAITCKFTIRPINERFLLDNVFRQWNSVIIQAHHRKKKIPMKIFEIMETMYNFQIKKLKSEVGGPTAEAISSRLRMKDLKHVQNEFANLMNQSKKIIGLEGKFLSDLELAENILKTTVTSKYAVKALSLKGHSTEAFRFDMEAFKDIYESLRPAILNLPDPISEELCHVTLQSTVLDLKDEAFYDLLDLDKFNFIKNFALPGIPIFSPVQAASQINPWALYIKNILVAPYNFVSQTALVLSASVGSGTTNEEDKDVYLRAGDESSRFNAIIPVYNEQVCNVLKPLFKSKIFSMMTTFCILKNANIIDINAHLAALACAFVKTITDFPIDNRPEFIKDRLKLIYFTSKVFEFRKGCKNYFETLMKNPNRALITETKESKDEIPSKCESLLKPCIILFMHKHDEKLNSNKDTIIKLMTVEYFGRCLSKYHETTPYLDHFVDELSTKIKREEWINNQVSNADGILNTFIKEHGELLKSYYSFEKLQKDLEVFGKRKFTDTDSTKPLFEIKPILEKIKKLFNPSSAGSISFEGLKAFAREMELSAEEINDIFSENNVLIYLLHALSYKSSQDRMEKPLPSYDEAMKRITENVVKEQNKIIASIGQMATKEIEDKYLEEYRNIHDRNFVKPMTPEEIIKLASERGVHVTSENFEKVFKYNEKSGLVRNCCMIDSCPYFLKPNRSFNQHLWIERKHSNRSHLVHKATLSFASDKNHIDEILNYLMDNSTRGTNGRKMIPPPSREDVLAIQSDIENLKLQYANLHRHDVDMVSV